MICLLPGFHRIQTTYPRRDQRGMPNELTAVDNGFGSVVACVDGQTIPAVTDVERMTVVHTLVDSMQTIVDRKSAPRSSQRPDQRYRNV